MDSLKKIFTREKAPKERAEEEVSSEVPVMEVSESVGARRVGEIEPIYIKSVDLNSIVDVQEATDELQDGNVLILNISPLMEEDPAELKRAIDQLRGISEGMGGDVGRLSESKVIATPKFVRIQFERAT